MGGASEVTDSTQGTMNVQRREKKPGEQRGKLTVAEICPDRLVNWPGESSKFLSGRHNALDFCCGCFYPNYQEYEEHISFFLSFLFYIFRFIILCVHVLPPRICGATDMRTRHGISWNWSYVRQ